MTSEALRLLLIATALSVPDKRLIGRDRKYTYQIAGIINFIVRDFEGCVDYGLVSSSSRPMGPLLSIFFFFFLPVSTAAKSSTVPGNITYSIFSDTMNTREQYFVHGQLETS
ncbi:hypothetical protein BO79DRAFT_279474 [Aspergillus costaricaensis CBS 115574]|uniref:Uncharacterized protein n=1 Tax=Aspergillus costaricaensis CBS 115574 TaxID=1448317 RepID=A0ACD1HZM2_9EURO|nr:hypothetical protein BO79DRAFT_279474 [Aspergillus costaricaensis CBS 115574]RAK82955.1 hypothetical protein BO79DRAFT_279474 [Aspergillus costaricaensis CBS 115574]